MSDRRTVSGADLALAARIWPSPNAARERRFAAEPGTPEDVRPEAGGP